MDVEVLDDVTTGHARTDGDVDPLLRYTTRHEWGPNNTWLDTQIDYVLDNGTSVGRLMKLRAPSWIESDHDAYIAEMVTAAYVPPLSRPPPMQGWRPPPRGTPLFDVFESSMNDFFQPSITSLHAMSRLVSKAATWTLQNVGGCRRRRQ